MWRSAQPFALLALNHASWRVLVLAFVLIFSCWCRGGVDAAKAPPTHTTIVGVYTDFACGQSKNGKGSDYKRPKGKKGKQAGDVKSATTVSDEARTSLSCGMSLPARLETNLGPLNSDSTLPCMRRMVTQPKQSCGG